MVFAPIFFRYLDRKLGTVRSFKVDNIVKYMRTGWVRLHTSNDSIAILMFNTKIVRLQDFMQIRTE